MKDAVAYALLWWLGLTASADPYVACPAKVITFEAAKLTVVTMEPGCNG